MIILALIIWAFYEYRKGNTERAQTIAWAIAALVVVSTLLSLILQMIAGL